MAVTFTLPCPGFPFTRRGLRVSVQSPSSAGVVHRRQLDDKELRSWVLRWDRVPYHLHNELIRIYELSEHGILPFAYRPAEELSDINVTMSSLPDASFDGPTRVSFEVILTEHR